MRSVIRTGVYKITCTANSRVYIGSAIDVEGRWAYHRWQLRNDHHPNKHLQRAWNKYSADRFLFEMVEETDAESLRDREQWWMEQTGSLDPVRGFNVNRADRPGDHAKKEYIITDPQGNEYRIKGLAEFCRHHSLKPDSMGKIALLQKKCHRGWHCRYADEDMDTWQQRWEGKDRYRASRKRYRLVSPEGVTHITDNLPKFAEEHGLKANRLRTVARPSRREKHFRGWSCEREDN